MTTTIPNPSVEQNLSDIFFGSKEKVCVLMRDAIRERREQRKMSPFYLDNICGFGSVMNKQGIRLPTCDEFEAEPEICMTSLIFGLASFPLELNIDDVLPIALNEKQKEKFIKEMETSQSGVTRTSGGIGSNSIPLRDQVCVYVLTRILNEVDKSNTKFVPGESNDKQKEFAECS